METITLTPEEAATQYIKNLGWNDDGTAEPNDIRKAFIEGISYANSNKEWKNEMAKANAAQVLSGYLWKKGIIEQFIDAVELSKSGVTIDQTKLLPALMNFQQWIYDHQIEPK